MAGRLVQLGGRLAALAATTGGRCAATTTSTPHTPTTSSLLTTAMREAQTVFTFGVQPRGLRAACVGGVATYHRLVATATTRARHLQHSELHALAVVPACSTNRGFAASSRPSHSGQPLPSTPTDGANDPKSKKKSKSKKDAMNAVVDKHVLYRGPWLLTFRLLVRFKVGTIKGEEGRAGALGSLALTRTPHAALVLTLCIFLREI